MPCPDCEKLLAQLTELRAAVNTMRNLQRDFFRTRAQSSLVASKAAEKRVDKLLQPAPQPKLF